MPMSNSNYSSAANGYFFGETDASTSFYIIDVTEVDGLAVQFNLVLPQNRDTWTRPTSVGNGALRIDFADNVANPISIRIGTSFQILNPDNLKDFVTYVSDFVFDYAGLDAQALLDRQDKRITEPEDREYLDSARFLQSAKSYAVKDAVNEFFDFVYSRENELLTQLGLMGVFTPQQIVAIHAQGVGNRMGNVDARLFAQKRTLLAEPNRKRVQQAFNVVLDNEYPKLLGPIEESKEIEKSSDEDSAEDDSKRNLYIAMGVVGVLVLGFAIGRRRDRI